MTIKETKRGHEFITKNLFSKNRISKDDRRLTNFLRFCCWVVSFFHAQKLCKNKPWYRLLEHHLKKADCEESQHLRIKEKITLSKEDLVLEELVVYDLLPKEYLPEFQRRYIKLKNTASRQFIFNRREKDVNESFETMTNSRATGCWYNVDQFVIGENDDLFMYFTSVSLQAIGLTESFYILKYTLRVNEKANEMLGKILSSNVHKSVQCISNGKWWKRKSLAGCYTYDFGEDAKEYALDDFILELKSVFWGSVQNRLFSKFFNWIVIPPSIEIYSSKTLSQNNENILDLMCMRDRTNIEVNDKKTVYFIPVQHKRKGKGSYNSKLIADISEFEGRDESGLYSFLDIEETICQNLAEYFVLDALYNHISEGIYDAQLQINKTIYEKDKLESFIKVKRRIDKKLYFFKRLYNEIIPFTKVKTSNNFFLNQYQAIFKNKYASDNPDFKHMVTFAEKYKSIFFLIKEKYNLINEVYKHFKENSELIESRYNYKTVKWTLIVCFLTLIATILLANNSQLLLMLWYYFREFISAIF